MCINGSKGIHEKRINLILKKQKAISKHSNSKVRNNDNFVVACILCFLKVSFSLSIKKLHSDAFYSCRQSA